MTDREELVNVSCGPFDDITIEIGLKMGSYSTQIRRCDDNNELGFGGGTTKMGCNVDVMTSKIKIFDNISLRIVISDFNVIREVKNEDLDKQCEKLRSLVFSILNPEEMLTICTVASKKCYENGIKEGRKQKLADEF